MILNGNKCECLKTTFVFNVMVPFFVINRNKRRRVASIFINFVKINYNNKIKNKLDLNFVAMAANH